VDASDAEIKRVFRKKARKYHPDSFRADNHEDGMTKEDAEEHFKELSKPRVAHQAGLS
jgi:curved DNA-binding protein CbpA